MSGAHHNSLLQPTPILSLHPTQMTVGMREVERKRKAFREEQAQKRDKTIMTHMVPVVRGPKGGQYVTDHHHMLLALHEDGQKNVYVVMVGDLSKADPEHFWTLMEFHGWAHPYDEKGRRCDYADLPKTIEGLRDDPYRALAGELRSSGGFAKDATPFSEFVWADFFRARIKRKTLVEDFDAGLSEALKIAKSPDADYLPGWCGAHEVAAAKPAKKLVKKAA